MTITALWDGQSNANGMARHKPGYERPAWLTYTQPVRSDLMGADDMFARAVHAATLQDVHIIKVAAKNTSIQNEWAPHTGWLYQLLVGAINSCPDPIDVQMRMQGEQDVRMRKGYLQAEIDFFASLRADVHGKLDDVPLALGQISDASARHYHPELVRPTREVMAMQAAYAALDPNATLVPTTHYGSSVHMSEAGYNDLGLKVAKMTVGGLDRAFLQTGDVTISRTTTIQLFDSGNNGITDNASFTRIMAGEGNDTIKVHGRFGYVWGESGNDNIWVSTTTTHVDGGAGADSLTILHSGRMLADGATDIERVVVAGRANVDASALDHGQYFAMASGARAAAALTATAFDDLIVGGRGIDRIAGGGGNDSITGGAGRDTLAGGDGDDTFVFTTRPDRIAYDRIIDFDPAHDTLAFSHTVFKGEPSDHATYDSATGGLSWDGVLVATLGPGHDAGRLHFLIV